MQFAIYERFQKYDDKQSVTDSIPGSPYLRKNSKWLLLKNNLSQDSHNTLPLIQKDSSQLIKPLMGLGINEWGNHKKLGSLGSLPNTSQKKSSQMSTANITKNHDFEESASFCTIVNTEDTFQDFDLSIYSGYARDFANSERCQQKNPQLFKIQQDFSPKYLMTSCRSEPSLPSPMESNNMQNQEV